MIRVIIFFCTMCLANWCLASPPQGFEAHSGSITPPPSDLQPVTPSAVNAKERLEQLNTQIAHIDDFLEKGGRYTVLVAETTKEYQTFLKLIVEAQAYCERRAQENTRRNTHFGESYRVFDADCRETVAYMNQRARDIAVQVDEIVLVAKDLEGVLENALAAKENKVLEKAVYEKDIELKRSLEHMGGVLNELNRTYERMVERKRRAQ